MSQSNWMFWLTVFFIIRGMALSLQQDTCFPMLVVVAILAALFRVVGLER